MKKDHGIPQSFFMSMYVGTADILRWVLQQRFSAGSPSRKCPYFREIEYFFIISSRKARYFSRTSEEAGYSSKFRAFSSIPVLAASESLSSAKV